MLFHWSTCFLIGPRVHSLVQVYIHWSTCTHRRLLTEVHTCSFTGWLVVNGLKQTNQGSINVTRKKKKTSPPNNQNENPSHTYQEESVVHARRGGQSECASETVELGTKGDVHDGVVESVAQSAHPSAGGRLIHTTFTPHLHSVLVHKTLPGPIVYSHHIRTTFT